MRTRTRSSSPRTSSSAGPGTPGVLVVRRELLTNRVPVVPGGGTVAYVNPIEHRYLDDPAHREEGGTPGDRRVDPRRAGLPAQGGGRRRRRSGPTRSDFCAARSTAWQRRPRASRSSATSTPSGCRSCRSSSAGADGGDATCTTTSSSRCSTTCSASSRAAAARAPGPYGHRLLGIDIERSHEFEREIAAGCEGIKPGWVRVNFNYFISEAVFDYIVEAVDLVADARLAAAARLPLRPGDRAVAAPRRAGRAAAAPARRSATTPTAR